MAAVIATLLGVLLATACTDADEASSKGDRAEAARDSRATACRAAARQVVDATQRYVDGAAGVDLDARGDDRDPPSPATTTPGLEAELTAAIEAAQRVRRQQRCEQATFDDELAAGLDSVTAEGPVAAAVLRQLRANLTGRVGTSPGVVPVAPGDDLSTVLAEAATGSTIELAAGDYRLDESLVLLRGVTLRGAGRGRTTISSTAGETAVLVLTGDRVSLGDLSVRRTGRAVGSVLVAGSEASVRLTDMTVSGARLGRSGGGAGILMTAARGERPRDGTTLEVTDVRLADNEAAGIVLTGSHRASIRAVEVSGSGQCGVCFLGRGGGAVRDSGFTGNGVAVAVMAAANPLVEGNRISGGEVGIQAADGSAPVLRRNVITGAARAAVVYAGDAAGRADGTRCRQVPYGFVVGPQAAPYLGENSCQVVSAG